MGFPPVTRPLEFVSVFFSGILLFLRSWPGHRLWIPREREEPPPIQAHCEKEVAAGALAPEGRVRVRGGEVCVNLVHDLEMHLTVKARWRRQRAHQPELAAPRALLR